MEGWKTPRRVRIVSTKEMRTLRSILPSFGRVERFKQGNIPNFFSDQTQIIMKDMLTAQHNALGSPRESERNIYIVVQASFVSDI